MKLTSLTIENFMPYKGETTLTFPQDPTRNVMVVFGDNMRGKTSLLNAIRWVFYGKAFGRHLSELPVNELLNREAALEGSWTMEVSVRFEADGHRYDLRRRASKRAHVAQPSRPEDFDVAFMLQKDNMAVSGHLIDAEINRFAPEQVSRFFLFDGELLQEYETLLIEGSEKGKLIKDAIEQVLGVPTLVHGRHEAATLLRGAQKQQTKDLSHVAGLESQAHRQASWQTKLETFENDMESLKTKLAATKLERTTLDDDLEKVDQVHQSKIRLDFAKERQKEIIAQQKALAEERLALLRDAWRDLLQPKLSVKQAFLFGEQSKITGQMDERSKLEARASDLRKILDTSSCPTCGQDLPENGRTIAGTELGGVESLLRTMTLDRGGLTRVSAEIQEITKLLRPGVGPRIQAIDAENRKLGVQLTRVENDAEALSEEIKGHDVADIARKRVLRDGLLREEGQIAGDISSDQKDIDSAKKELAIIAKALQNLPQARASRSTAMVRVYTTLEQVFGESIERLRNNLRGEVEARATESFKKLTTQKAYQGLEINKNYGLTILDEKGAKVTVRSAGAEQIVALSLIDGLARTGRAAGPVVMDTPFGRLDLTHRENILRYLPTTTSQLILLVHDGEIRKETDLSPIAERIGAAYEIKEVNSRHSKIEKVIS
ncbi:AAA family ATPase [Janthinobacterium rivuli]|uniref:AAA family ATPase n=1 Tax=Janthinobacterium sp. FT68W TaxID=2654255 RepID=UPI0012653CDE|nr:AAA family ATPase [Janthinobacterium sp. FT68W]KAB8054770.1 AAA family ATPase [Janthinobacterium sp. FT68W]